MNARSAAITDVQIRQQLTLGEDSHWEFKELEFRGNRPVSPRRDDLANETAAFANTAGGIMLLGVSDAGEVQDMSREQLGALEKLVVGLSCDSIDPPVRIRTCLKQLEESGRFLLVEVPKGDAVHRSPGGHFLRTGSTARKMSGEESMRPGQRRSQARFRWFDEQTVEGTGPASLTEGLWKPLLSSSSYAAPEIPLEKMKLLAHDDQGVLRATVAGILLCTEHPEGWLPNAVITAACYEGRDQASGQLDAQEIVGPIYRQVEQALRFVMRNMGVAARKIPGRVDVPQYSSRALFEALVNAVAHRDYSIRGSKIRLLMFEDRLEIHSPGGLPNNLTVESMAERQSTRNETLVFVLGRLSTEGMEGVGDRQFFMERRGDGIPIIRKETEEITGKQPEFRLLDDAELCLTLPAASLSVTSAHVRITAHGRGQAVPGVDLFALFPNRTWKRTTTDREGVGELNLHSTHLPMILFAASPGCCAYIERDWIPEERAIALEMLPLAGGGSVIFPEATGNIPGLRGVLNPVRDSLERTYLYASNIAINGGQAQPVYFAPGEELRLTDADGAERVVRIIDIVGRSALVEYCSEAQDQSQ